MDINEVARCKLFFLPRLRPCDATDAAAGHHAGAFFTSPEVMHLCGLSRSTIYELIRKGNFRRRWVLAVKMWPGCTLNHRMDGRAHCRTQTGVRRMMCPLCKKSLFLACLFPAFADMFLRCRKIGSRAWEPEQSNGAYDAPCVFFCVAINATERQIWCGVWSVVQMAFRASCPRPLLCRRVNGSSGGAASGLAGILRAGILTPVWAIAIERENSGIA